MKFSEKWLRQWVNPKLDTQALAEQITMLGLEVDDVSPAAADFHGVVVGKVISAEQHPDADRLKVCQVQLEENADPIQIVCGGKNVRQDLKVPVIKVGGALGDFKIKKAKLRGEESNGMICSESELGLSESSEGIMELSDDAPIGTDVREYLELNDMCIDVDLTPNRADCASILGVARDVAATNQIDMTWPKLENIPSKHKDTLKISIDASTACPRYVGRIIKNIKPNIESPLWLKEVLRRSGIRSIHPVVDVGNYVMLELGQPMHAFDLHKLQGNIHVRMAKIGEHFELLDGEKINLDENTLLIADDKKPLALAGIMGGIESGVTVATTNLFLESAYFEPIGIRKTVQRYQINSDSSYRFERGVDFSQQVRAIERMTQLLLDIVGGEAGPVTDVVDKKQLPSREKITLRRDRISHILGVDIPDEKVVDYLTRLEMSVKKSKTGWEIIPPNHRFDIELEIDLIEELARLYGYNNIENQTPTIQMKSVTSTETQLTTSRIRQLFIDRGYSEIRSYSFVDPKLEALVAPGHSPKALVNPISSEMAVMRSSLLPGLLQTLSYNLARQQSRAKLFEIGMVFKHENDQLKQDVHFGAIVFGQQTPEQWGSENKDVDFFDLKGDLMSLFNLAGTENTFEFVVNTHPALTPGQTAEIKQDGKHVGWCGKLHPTLQSKLDIRGDAYCFDLNLASITKKRLPEYKPVSKFPEIRRDIAVVVDKNLPAQEIIESIRAQDQNLLQRVEIFDIYSGAGVDEGKKSVAIAMTFQLVDRTLTDTEVNELVAKITSVLNKQFDATLR